MYITPEQIASYRSKLIAYYFNKQKIKDMRAVKRQINNLDSNNLLKNYNLIFKDE